jgi:ribosomal protein L5
MDYKEMKSNLKKNLQKKLGIKNINQVPVVEKVIVSI